MYENSFPDKRFKLTLDFIKKHIAASESILDLGVENPFSIILKKDGFKVTNTKGEDLDNDFTPLISANTDVVTAIEILEHLLNPYTVLSEIKAKKLIVSVPLRLWFAGAYKSKTDLLDRHYHEFEPWQFNWLLEKSGWKIVDSTKFTHPVKKIGLRPLLRLFTNRYYLVYAERI